MKTTVGHMAFLALALCFVLVSARKVPLFDAMKAEHRDPRKEASLKMSEIAGQQALFPKMPKERKGDKGNRHEQMRVIAGSALPDCSHACGGCSPCRRVAVSLKCLQESESCPMAYRCMCNGRAFPIP